MEQLRTSIAAQIGGDRKGNHARFPLWRCDVRTALTGEAVASIGMAQDAGPHAAEQVQARVCSRRPVDNSGDF